MKLPNHITRFWGKARPAGDGLSWHPLAYHSLDVAACMQALLGIRTKWLTRLAHDTALGEEETKKRLVLVAAMHDLGKFAENFQCKVPELAEAFGHTPLSSNAGHGSVGQAVWELCEDKFNLSQLSDWMHASFSHHGTPVAALGHLPDAMSPQSQGAALAFCDEIFALMGRPNDTELANKAYEKWRIAGLVILADWIGSNQNWFAYEKPVHSLEAYWAIAQNHAENALKQTNLAEAPCAAAFDLRTLLGHEATPSPLQTWAQQQTPSHGPQLFMIEDLTGAGKTEAALILCHRLMQSGCAEGFYWALPSMATANGLYERLKNTYKSLFDTAHIEPSLVLAHSARDLHDGFQASIQTGDIGNYGGETDQDQSAEAACAAFYADDRKKTFLAQVGIGTLDQALLGALPVRHQSLRLAALSRRVLVVDEAHAYDEYMTKGLETLLMFQKRMGGSVIILSATLTQKQKQRFAIAFGATNQVTQTAFPLVTHIAPNNGITETPIKAARGTRRDLHHRRFDTPQSVMDALIEKAKMGYCGVYICNTVAEALEAFDYIRAHHDTVDLFHARYCLKDRIARETAILARFGKNSQPEARRGQILVATQVVEQSLDLDFDYMATDLCPVDLLIQRAGRLHRHGHRPLRPKPELWVVSPSHEGEIGSDWYSSLFKKGQYVYPNFGQLWRTMKELDAVGGLRLNTGSPRDLIEPVFDPETYDIPECLTKASLKAEATANSERGVAGLNFLKLRDFNQNQGAWASDVYTPTRLGEPTVKVRLAQWANGALSPWADAETRSWRMSEISLPKWRCRETVAPDSLATKAVAEETAKWNLRHDAPPILTLTPTKQDGIWVGKIRNDKGEMVDVVYSTLGGLQYI